MSAKIIGSGHYLPSKILSNFDLEKLVDTSDEWITSRTGIKNRRMVETENTSDLAFEASLKAIKDAKINKNEIDLVIVATITPDKIFPSVAATVQKKLGLNEVFAMDINAACTGFIYALETAVALLKQPHYQKALVIGAEVLTKVLDFTDRNTCILFGDGAGAFILEASEKNHFLAFDIHSKGQTDQTLGLDFYPLKENFQTPKHPTPFMYMNGKEVFKFAVDVLPKTLNQLCENITIKPDQLDFVVAHQANQRILNKAAKDLNMDQVKFISTLEETGNTSAASIPIAFDIAKKDGRIKPGHRVGMVGFGGGLTWGGVIVEIN
jgi:3-oxoacyl-[acyl-carrier-protein] synthase-3